MPAVPRLVLLLCFLAAPRCFGAAFGADADAAFAEANRRFEAGDHAAAAAAYEALAESGLASAELFYNLGAAKHRLGEGGEAALWMRRALLLEPGMPEARQSLGYLRSQFAWFEFSEGGLRSLLASLPPVFWRWSVSLLVWSGLLLLAAAFSLPQWKERRSSAVTWAMLLLMAAFVVARIDRYRERNLAIGNFATVVAPETSALTAPAPEAKAVVALPPGSELRLLQQSGPWTYAEIPGDLRGWVRTEAIAPVWPLDAGLESSGPGVGEPLQ
jgi:tetratricopeptide (TPR) repeat protein